MTPHPAFEIAKSVLNRFKVQTFELYLNKKRSMKIESRNMALESMTRAEDVGLSIRVLKNGKMGFSYTTSLEKPAIEHAVQTAVEISEFMPEDPFLRLHSFSELPYPSLEHWDQDGLSISTAEKIKRAFELERMCRGLDKRITQVRSAGLTEVAYETQMLDHHNEHIFHQATLFAASISCKAEENGEGQMGGDFDASPFLADLNLELVAKRSAETATELLGAKTTTSRACPAVFRNAVVSELIEFLAPSFSAEEIDKGKSMLLGLEGQNIFSDRFSLADDATLPRAYSSQPFDGEGYPCQKTSLIDEGLFVQPLTNLYYAAKQNRKPTGNAARSIKSPPSISHSNLVMKNGKDTHEALIGQAHNGVLITDLMGVHTANPITGDFSLGASGILIENGKLTTPIRGFAVAGNVMGIFKNLQNVGNDSRSFGGTICPSVLVPELSISGD